MKYVLKKRKLSFSPKCHMRIKKKNGYWFKRFPIHNSFELNYWRDRYLKWSSHIIEKKEPVSWLSLVVFFQELAVSLHITPMAIIISYMHIWSSILHGKRGQSTVHRFFFVLVDVYILYCASKYGLIS